MKKLLVLTLLAACGGSEKPAIEEPEADRQVRERPDEDEEEDDGLDVQSTRGKMDPADVSAGIEPHAAALQACYLDKVGAQKYLGGKVELKWEVTGEGAITSAQIAWSDLGHWEVEKCMLDLARQMTFAAPRGGAADFTVPLELDAARKSAVWWDEEKGNATVSKVASQLATCAEEAAVADPTDVTVTLYLGARGKVQSAGFASPALIDDAWAACAHAKVMAWQLSDPKGQIAKLAFVYRPGETPEPSWAVPEE